MKWFISIRYLLSHKRQTLVCVAGVTISVLMFIAMSSMMNGFTDKFIIETVESSGHVTVYDEPREHKTQILEKVYKDKNALLVIEGVKPREEVKKIKNPTGLMTTLRRLPDVEAAAAMVTGDGIISYGAKTYGVMIFGVEPEQQTIVTTIGDKVTKGAFERLKTTADGIVLGRGIAQTIGAQIDDTISLSSPTGGRTIAQIVGLFDTRVTPAGYGRSSILINCAQKPLDKKTRINPMIPCPGASP